ncbi:MAG TPA: hypothetical protein EYQ83_05265 [Acidobacteria bacterium]|nr:hypothetical protein [Acidobacteriota bacterium]
MKRRDFLRLRTEAAIRVAELSCERLYMHYQHARVTTMPTAEAERHAVPERGEAEPAAELTARTPDQLFGEIERQLQRADVLRLVDDEWLVVDDYRHHVEKVLAAFRGRGGRIESPGRVREATR